MSDFKAKMHHMPQTRWRAYSAPRLPIAVFNRPTFKGVGEGSERSLRKERPVKSVKPMAYKVQEHGIVSWPSCIQRRGMQLLFCVVRRTIERRTFSYGVRYELLTAILERFFTPCALRSQRREEEYMNDINVSVQYIDDRPTSHFGKKIEWRYIRNGSSDPLLVQGFRGRR